jgi:hypothetical protein
LTREEGFELINKHDPEIPEALEYYLKITGMSRDEFFTTMEKHRVEKLKNIEIPLKPKKRRNKETIKPFVEQLIDEEKTQKDLRA